MFKKISLQNYEFLRKQNNFVSCHFKNCLLEKYSLDSKFLRENKKVNRKILKSSKTHIEIPL